MIEIRYWNELTNRPGHIWVEKLICKRCQKSIKGKFVTPTHSFDLYHPSCYKKKPKGVVFIEDDIIENLYAKKVM